MDCKNIAVLDLSNIDVVLDPDEAKVLSLFPVDQDGSRMLDNMVLVSVDKHTYVARKAPAQKRITTEKRKSVPIGWNVDFLHGAVF